MAFPWGAGDAGLLAGLVEDLLGRGSARGRLRRRRRRDLRSGTRRERRGRRAPLLEWIEENLPEAADEIVLTGASAGGVGVFHAALAMPGRVAAILAMPGRTSGEASLESLAGVPVLLMVGEHDRNWVTGSESTAERLRAAGAKVTLEVVPGRGTSLRLPEQMEVDPAHLERRFSGPCKRIESEPESLVPAEITGISCASRARRRSGFRHERVHGNRPTPGFRRFRLRRRGH